MSMSSDRFTFAATGTTWTVRFFESLSAQQFQHLQQIVRDRIEVFEQTYSRFRPESLVSKIAQAAGSYQFPADAALLFTLYRRLYEITGGAFTPLIGQALVDAGYDAQYSLKPKQLKRLLDWDQMMTVHGSTITTREPLQLDFGAAGKGYLIDLVADLLIGQNIRSFSIDAGGDILHHGDEQPLRVGLEFPGKPDQVIGVVDLANKSIAGSSASRRDWGDFHHIIDSQSLTSPRHILATWVVADSTMVADALATSLFLCAPEPLMMEFGFDYLILSADFSVKKSSGFTAELFIHNP